MRDFFKSRWLQVALSVVLISVGVSLLASLPGSTIVPRTVGAVTAPMQKISTYLSTAAENISTRRKTEQEYEGQITELKKEVRRLRAIAIDYYEIKKENTQYAKFYELKKQNNSFKFVQAAVVARDPNELFYGFTIDKGSMDGVQENSPVITANGLVGWVSAVGVNSCKVSTILSAEARIGSVDKVTRDSGVIIGDVKLSDANLTKMMFLPAQNQMKPGDIVTTSGLGGIYPKDLPIGEVVSLTRDDFDSSYCAQVEPFDKIGRLMDVFVVVDFKGRNEIDTDSLK